MRRVRPSAVESEAYAAAFPRVAVSAKDDGLQRG